MRVKPAPQGIPARIEIEKSLLRHIVDGLVATAGIQYSSVATFGTTAVQVFNKLIDPGYTIKLKECEVGLTQRFTGLNGSLVGSIMYHWTARSEYEDPVGTFRTSSYVNITGTYQKAVGTLTTSDDTFSGYIETGGSLPFAPVRLVLTAVGIQPSVCEGKVKNSSYVRMVGVVVPGA